jgi:hypothetical protein
VIDHGQSHIDHVLRSVEQLLALRPERGELDRETILALDIVTHALEFTRVEGALSLWREALWGRRLPAQVRIAIIQLLHYLMSAAVSGDMGSITEVCGCLHKVIEPDVFKRSGSATEGRGTPYEDAAWPAEYGLDSGTSVAPSRWR